MRTQTDVIMGWSMMGLFMDALGWMLFLGRDALAD